MYIKEHILYRAQSIETQGISRSTLCDIEKGRYLVSSAMAAKIAKLYGLVFQEQLDRANLKLRVAVA